MSPALSVASSANESAASSFKYFVAACVAAAFTLGSTGLPPATSATPGTDCGVSDRKTSPQANCNDIRFFKEAIRRRVAYLASPAGGCVENMVATITLVIKDTDRTVDQDERA